MSARRLYLVCYDIREPARLRRVHGAMLGWGEWLQYSVFICALERKELFGMKGELGEIISHAVDSVMIVDLGVRAGRSAPITFMGMPMNIAAKQVHIV